MLNIKRNVPKLKESFVNEKFYEKSKNFVIEALTIIAPLIRHTQAGPKPEYLKLLLQHRDEIENLPEFKECIQIMESDPTISKHIGKLVGVPGRLSSRSAWDFLQRILSRLMKSYYGKKRFDEYLFLKMYRDLETLFYDNTIPMVILVPLQNFRSNISCARLSKGLMIRKITCDEQQDLVQDLENLKLTFDEVTQIKYMIEYNFQEKKIFDDSHSFCTRRIDTIEKVIISLRLFRRGDIGSYIVLERPVLDTTILAGEARYHSLVSFPQGRTYSLMKKDFHKFRIFWKGISKICFSKFARLKLALDRFEYAYQRISKDDKLLDYVISFEMLLGSNERDSLTYKISVRFSRLCQLNSIKRNKYFKSMKEIYDLRNAIVHGDERRKRRLWKKVNIDDVEEKLRESIKTYMKIIKKRNKDHDSIIRQIDFN